jgi:hypothetical protein
VFEQQIEHIAPLGFDGHMKCLWPPSPERMRTDRIHKPRRCGEHRANLVDAARSDAFEKIGDGSIGLWRVCGHRDTFPPVRPASASLGQDEDAALQAISQITSH